MSSERGAVRDQRRSLLKTGALATLLAALGPVALPAALAAAATADGPPVVSAAASLKVAFTEVGALPLARTAAAPVFNFGASGELLAQIRGGAPVDVFAAASHTEMDALERGGFLLAGSRADFAANELVLIVPASSAVPVASLVDLAKPAVGRIAIANAATAPAGRYAAEVLASAGLGGALRTKLVPAETVRQILDWVARGEVDAGLVYATDARSRPAEVRVAATAPAGSHAPIVYPIAILKDAANPAAARAFVAAVLSGEGRAILARHGFLAPPAAK